MTNSKREEIIAAMSSLLEQITENDPSKLSRKPPLPKQLKCS